MLSTRSAQFSGKQRTEYNANGKMSKRLVGRV